MSSTLLAPATTMRCKFEQRASAIIGSRIRSLSGMGWAMCAVLIEMPLRTDLREDG
jgi:hypothetical protein